MPSCFWTGEVKCIERCASNADWALLYEIQNPNAYGTAASDLFGNSVAANSGYVFAGSREDQAGATDAGRVYVFNIETGAAVTQITDPNSYSTAANDYFSEGSPAKRTTAATDLYFLASALGEDSPSYTGGSSTGPGVTYIFNAATFALLHTIPNPNPYGSAVADYFGWHADICDSYAVIAASLEDTAGATDTGHVYVFSPSTGSLLRTITNPNNSGPETADYFGNAVAVSDSYLAVSATGENSSSGVAYVFDPATGNLLHTLQNPNPAAGTGPDYFGYGIALSGDKVAVSAYGQEYDGYPFATRGIVYVFSAVTGSLLHTIEHPDKDQPTGDEISGFGFGLRAHGDWLVAMVLDDGETQGRIYIFDITTGELLKKIVNPHPELSSSGGSFGNSVAITDTHLVVGAYGQKAGASTFSGAVYIYELI